MSQNSAAELEVDANVRTGVRLRKRPGPVPGAPKHKGMFSGPDDPRICRDRKKSREPIIARAQALAAEHIEESTELLVQVMRDPSQPVRTRVDCALHLQARAAGSPVSINALVDLTEGGKGNGNGANGQNGQSGMLGSFPSVPPDLDASDATLLAFLKPHLKSGAIEDAVYTECKAAD